MNRAIQDAIVKRYRDESDDQLRQHLDTFVRVHDYARRLKTLKGLAPDEFVRKTPDGGTPSVQAQSARPNAGTKRLGTTVGS